MLEPANTVIKKCGGVQKTAEMSGRHPSNVGRWARPRSERGTGGLIPSDVQPILLAEAIKRGIDLVPEDFFDLVEIRRVAEAELAGS